ncbi:MAG: hypothetical protein O6943_04965 [Bacteroidetes bacterium]|nr:hypothetical protein [Bacteroidota bacterium]
MIIAGKVITSLPEIIVDNGLFFDTHQPDQLATCMKQIYSDTELRKTLEQAGLQQSKKFTWQKAARIVLSAMEEMVYENKLNQPVVV